MRTTNLLLIAGALVISAATPVLADGPGAAGPGARGNETAKNHTASNHTANATEREARHDALVEARHAALESFKENRTAALAAYHASLNATRASFLENKTRVLEACKATRDAAHDNKTADNETNDTNKTNETDTKGGSNGHCVRDGLKPLIEKAHAEIKAAQDAFHDAMKTAREHALASFQKSHDDADAKYGRP